MQGGALVGGKLERRDAHFCHDDGLGLGEGGGDFGEALLGRAGDIAQHALRLVVVKRGADQFGRNLLAPVGEDAPAQVLHPPLVALDAVPGVAQGGGGVAVEAGDGHAAAPC